MIVLKEFMMTQAQWESIEKTINDLAIEDKLELIRRLSLSIRVHQDASAELARRQKDRCDRLRRDLSEITCDQVEDGFSNRDHDRVLYGTKA